MKPLGSGQKKGRRGLCTKDASATAQKRSPAQFKLRASPLVTKKQPNLEMKPKAAFLTSTGVGLPTEKQHLVGKAKPSVFTMNSFMRPVSTGDAPKKSSGFSFMKFQPKSGKLAREKTSFASKTPFMKKFSIGSLSKTSGNSSGESGSTNKETSHKPQGKSALPFAFRATSAAKKRKAESPTNEEMKSGFPSKIGRGNSSCTLRSSAKRNGKGNPVWAVQRALQGNTSFATKIDRVEVNNGNVLKKRSLLETTTTSAPKRSKISAQVAVEEHGDSTKLGSGADADTSLGDEDLPSSPIPPTTREQIPSPKADSDPAKSVQLTCLSSTQSPSPGDSDDCLNEIGEFLAMKRFCCLDDDKEDDFLTRASVVQDFTDRVGLEQKQFRSRLLDAHADVSESLLDALTVLLAEEGGVGIDKLDFDMDIDVDVGNAFLQENGIQVIQ